MANESILVVDDEKLNRDLLSRRLKKEGYEVFTAEGGLQALDLIKALGRIDLVLLDVMMPKVDGFETLRLIRESHSAVELPVIMATAIGESDSIVKALNMGANDYVTKPINFDILKARLQSHFARKAAAIDLSNKNTRQSFEPKVGEKLGNYRILEEIGKGGTATVYLAEDLHLPRRVALKILHREVAENERSLERFLREAKAIARLQHPGIVEIYEIGETPCHFIAMQYLQGECLDKICERGALNIAKSIDYTEQIVYVLKEIHEQGIIHRDLKPQNLIVDSEDKIHIMDFGIAKMTDVNFDNTLTQTGMVLGTPRYMAPEFLDSRLGKATFASDFFPLGLMLYEMLTGERAITGDTFHSITYEIMSREPASPSAVNPLISSRLDQLCLKMQNHNPEERPQTAEEILHELELIKEELF